MVDGVNGIKVARVDLTKSDDTFGVLRHRLGYETVIDHLSKRAANGHIYPRQVHGLEHVLWGVGLCGQVVRRTPGLPHVVVGVNDHVLLSFRMSVFSQ
ncbi:unannotated protein [freshwater metagenome]|uniref:Unannotated protein n=1 Tax=freshwater metagenome TaxID=449393 RepID=A0A6J6EWL0_9ZZZZ